MPAILETSGDSELYPLRGSYVWLARLPATVSPERVTGRSPREGDRPVFTSAMTLAAEHRRALRQFPLPRAPRPGVRLAGRLTPSSVTDRRGVGDGAPGGVRGRRVIMQAVTRSSPYGELLSVFFDRTSKSKNRRGRARARLARVRARASITVRGVRSRVGIEDRRVLRGHLRVTTGAFVVIH